MGESRIRRRLVFRGDVQGVGFRWRARHAAAGVGATGWVRNEADGSVTMELQGSEAQIDRVLQSVESGRYIRIEAVDARTIPVEPEER
ncbi:MAG: acylphosphatase, partial [Oscillospiraceae bacterium]|nr:acylphosphatase [Oscillospiraceae bacterium]